MTAYDVVVIGGGPAGLAAAIRARGAGLRVVVVEPREAPIDKACGEGILPHGVEALATLGVHDLEGFPISEIAYVDARDPGRVARGHLPGGGGVGVRRTALHGALHQRARAVGVEWHRGRIGPLTAREDEIRAGPFRAAYAIAADGLRSPIRRELGLELPARRAPRFGTRRHFSIAPWSPGVEIHLADGAEAYVTPVAADTVGIAILTRCTRSFDALLPTFPRLAARVAGATPASRERGAGPFEQRARSPRRGRVLLVGDAAGYVDPLTGEGVSLGVRSACAAIDCIADDAPHRYDAMYRALVRRHTWVTVAMLHVVGTPAYRRPFLEMAARSPALFAAVLAWIDAAHPKTARPLPLFEWGQVPGYSANR